MADAPKSGGGSWEPFEIVLVIIVAIALLNGITGNRAGTQTSIANEVQPTTTQDSAVSFGSDCGLSVESPLPNAVVTTSLVLRGAKTGCDWKPVGEVALYAQLVDIAGKPMSPYQTVKNKTLTANTGLADPSATFDTTITVTGKPKKGRGYLILVAPEQKENKSVTYRIPVMF